MPGDLDQEALASALLSASQKSRYHLLVHTNFIRTWQSTSNLAMQPRRTFTSSHDLGTFMLKTYLYQPHAPGRIGRVQLCLLNLSGHGELKKRTS